jgi:arylsulfatase A
MKFFFPLFAFFVCLPWAEAAQGGRSNVVLILLDNVGQEWFGCYGGEAGCTPEIDRLAATGVRFEHCYTAPVCGPSRVVALTGRYPHTTGFRLHHDAALYSGGGLDWQREILFPRVFQAAGHATGLVGKWQVNHLYDEPEALTRHGFDEHLAWPGSLDRDQMDAGEWERYEEAVKKESVEDTMPFIQQIESRYWDPVFLRQGKRERHAGKFGPDVAQAFALDFLRRHRDKAFMLYYPMVLAHGNAYPNPVTTTPLNRDADRAPEAMYGDMLRYADRLVGEVARELEVLGLRDNTLLLVASDNGTEQSLSTRRDGRVVKGGLYQLNEAGGEVALLAHCPAQIPGGRVLPLADFTDLYPTMCEFAGVKLDARHRPDGRSFAGCLRDDKAAPHREWILNEYHTTRVVRDERFKLYSEGPFFDADADPEETQNLADDPRPEVKRAREKLQAVLNGLPADVPPPFPLRSQSGFKIRTAERALRR